MSQERSRRYHRKHDEKKKKSTRKINPLLLAFMMIGVSVLAVVLVKETHDSAAYKAIVKVRGAPSLQADQDLVDLGNVKLGQTVNVQFGLTNIGDKTLEFSKAPYTEVAQGC